MEVARWEQVKGVLYEVLEQPAEERSGFLLRMCGEDDLLRAEVESLLETEEEADDFIEEPIIRRDESDLPVERRIGPYEVVERIGRGGMGVVFLARRADREFDQKVAIKVVKKGMDTEEILSRFRHERQILAHLDHPNIARLLDGGTTSDGRPYFVMEHVEGEPIRQYCDTQGLRATERLRLFLAVCDAVHFAHQNLVVHRDLKPANILVTADGTVKLLDFGIARLLGPDGASGMTRKVMGGLLLTPEYASPEQLRGNPVTTVSDVYSLGILLYELLAGRRPFAEEESEGALIEATRNGEPKKPSTALKQRTPTTEVESAGGEVLRGVPEDRLAGDLDYIALKALRREPGERYTSVRELADDIERHLKGYPVLARKGATFYVASRFLRRHWRSLSAASLALTLVSISQFQSHRAESQMALERAKAERRLVRAVGTEDFLKSIFEGADPEKIRNRQLSLYEIIDQSAEKVKTNEKVAPESRAGLMVSLGLVFKNLDQWDRAEELFRESLNIRTTELGEREPLVAESRNNLGLVLRLQGRYVEAEMEFREAISIVRGNDSYTLWLATYLNNLAGLLRVSGNDMGEVIALFEESIRIKEEYYGKGAPVKELGSSFSNLGNVWLALGEYEKAEPLFEEALRIFSSLELTDLSSKAIHNMGVLYRDRGDLEQAEDYLRETIRLRQDIYQKDHSAIAPVLRSLAVCRQLQDDLGEAEMLYLKVLEIQRRRWEGGHRNIAITLREIAQLHLLKDAPEVAKGYVLEALDMMDKNNIEVVWLKADLQSVYGGVLLAQGRYKEAKNYLRQGHDDLVAARGSKIRWSREAAERLADLDKVRR